MIYPESSPKMNPAQPLGMNSILSIRRALLSVSDKSGLLDLARALHEHGAELLASGGTAKAIRDAGLPVKDVSELTGFPEMMGGRVKTLHPKVHGGLLMRRGEDDVVAEENGIAPIDMVVINLYPFEETIKKEGVTEAEAIEQIDIGGPAMLRSAAKNFEWVAAVTDTADYAELITELKSGGVSRETRKNLAQKVFELTAHYDAKIAEYFRNPDGGDEKLQLNYVKVMQLRYGENPHQNAVFFKDPENHGSNVVNSKVLQGKELSFNNIIDTDAALELVKDFDKPAAAIIKHMNPCGAATADDITTAFKLAHEVDPMAAFGCVIALNRPCTLAIAEYINEAKMFVEIVIAPDFEPAALERLSTRKNLRLLTTGPLKRGEKERNIKTVSGGILVQTADQSRIEKEDLKVVTKVQPTDDQIEAMLFARTLVKHIKSNAVAFAKTHEQGGAVATGIGAGQMSRVDSVIIARRKGGDRVPGSVMASDAFFPFPDAVEEAQAAGVTALIQPGGSIRDQEVIDKADELGLAMVFTGVRSFKH